MQIDILDPLSGLPDYMRDAVTAARSLHDQDYGGKPAGVKFACLRLEQALQRLPKHADLQPVTDELTNSEMLFFNHWLDKDFPRKGRRLT